MGLPPHEEPIVPVSRLYLPGFEAPPATVLEYLFLRFPRMPSEIWVDRVHRGVVTFDDGRIVTPRTPYARGQTVLYRREVPDEPPEESMESILFHDSHILVADKPHGMVVSPTGRYLERSLLVRLRRRTGIGELAPMHRLDQETAGVILFSVDPPTRGAYHQMFPEGRVEKEYAAVAHLREIPVSRRWEIRNRLGPASPWYRQQIVSGPVNAETVVELQDAGSHLGLFRIRPRTGKQHQIRVHMAALGFPILGDPLYPEERPRPVPDQPMRLVARRLAFVDPISGEHRQFESAFDVGWPPDEARETVTGGPDTR